MRTAERARRRARRHDSVSRSLLQQATVYLVPSMNPDGAWRGHLRTNACGINLNRAWAKPSLSSSPEVYHVLRKMRETGVDMLVDVHGDECIPHNFIAYSEGIPGWTAKMATCKDKFSKFLMRANPDFQTARAHTSVRAAPCCVPCWCRFQGSTKISFNLYGSFARSTRSFRS